jgi:hypothetical protein
MYPYHDEAGALLFEVVRFEPKDFRQRRPDGSDGYTWNLNGVRRVPFKLPELLKADPQRTVFVVEGEKDVESVFGIGELATCNAGGAGKWGTNDPVAVKAALGGRRVVLLPDADEPGRKHVEDVAARLQGIAREVRILALPGLGPKQDVSDWIADGGTALQLLELAAATPVWGKRADPEHAPTDEPATGVEIILAYFRERYQPVYRKGQTVRCRNGEEVQQSVACAVPNSKLIERLAAATDAPCYAGGGIKRPALPGFFKTWAKVAWGDLLDSLPDEDGADLGTVGIAREEFHRLVRDALLTTVVLGEVLNGDQTRTERRSLIDWCYRFAKPGPWRSIRSLRCWCKLAVKDGGEVELRVAIRHELFAQIRADRRLSEMGANTFTRRATRYGVGTSDRGDRPHGLSAVVLDAALVADLIAGLPDEEPQDQEKFPDG